MNAPEGKTGFVPKQAIAPTPQLYDELVSDSMENLAKASLSLVGPITDGCVINDNGCGTGAATAALIELVTKQGDISVSVKGSDINKDALAVYRKHTPDANFPIEGIESDSNALWAADSTFDLTIGNALLFVLPDDGEKAVKEIHRTLKPSGTAIFNSWKYLPNLPALEAAAKATRPEGTPLPRQGLEKWASGEFLKSVVEKGGFETVTMHEIPVATSTASGLDRFANMLWSFIGGTTPVGWLEADEGNWDKAIEVIKGELKKTDGYKELEGGRDQLQFIANVAIAKK